MVKPYVHLRLRKGYKEVPSLYALAYSVVYQNAIRWQPEELHTYDPSNLLIVYDMPHKIKKEGMKVVEHKDDWCYRSTEKMEANIESVVAIDKYMYPSLSVKWRKCVDEFLYGGGRRDLAYHYKKRMERRGFGVFDYDY